MKLKYAAIGALMLGSAVLGDYCNIKDRIIEPIMYRNVKIDEHTYHKPFQLEKKYKINEKGNLEVYLGCDKEWYKVSEELRVNERSLGQSIKKETKEIIPYMKKKISDFGQWLNETFKEGETGGKK
ncbi:hypothetical protein FJZ53_01175 [Candidatus Woesearchaeota archaeon]|nr:hypothetical protein [Candidatus Woesearchaeota archaeon]